MTVRLRLGRWLFQHRGWTPLPLLLAQGFWADPQNLDLGLAVLFAGEAMRLWAVGHIGGRSRTRGEAVGALETGGPFGLLRNPLYLGNGGIALAFGLWGGALWAGAWAVFFAVQYSLIVRWEESVLSTALGEEYPNYCEQVPRWLPLGGLSKRQGQHKSFGSDWNARQAFRSERATLLAIAIVGIGFWLSAGG